MTLKHGKIQIQTLGEKLFISLIISSCYHHYLAQSSVWKDQQQGFKSRVAPGSLAYYTDFIPEHVDRAGYKAWV